MHDRPERMGDRRALIEDLAQRGLLEATLVLVTSEMGRKPADRRPAVRRSGRRGTRLLDSVHECIDGRRRHPRRPDLWQTDAHAASPAENPGGPEDITKKVYHAMGIENLEAIDLQGRPYNRLEDGQPLVELFG